jgi:4-carboxymuconolactone decarboxylase
MDASKTVGLILLAGILLSGRIYGQTPLPKDVYPDSRFRLPLPQRADMDDYGKKVFDELADPSRRSLVGLQGPAGIRLYSPRVAKPMSDVNTYLRTGTGLGDRLTEIAIMVTARAMDNQFEWNAHEIAGLKAGVEPAIVDLIKYRKPAYRKPAEGLGDKETVIIRFGRELLDRRKVSSVTFGEALRLFGPRGLVDLTSLMGHYAATSVILTAFDMQLPQGQQPLLPIP